MSEISIEDLRKEILEIADYENIENPIIITENESEHCSGYTSVMTFFTVRGRNKELKMILKAGSRNVNLRQNKPVKIFFERELYFYKVVCKEFQNFLSEKSDREGIAFNITPKYFGGCTEEYNEYLILENLLANDYKMLKTSIYIDHTHLDLIFKTLSKFHATSFTIKDQKHHVYQTMLSKIDDCVIKYFDLTHFDKALIEMALEVKQKVFNLPAEQLIYNAYSTYIENIPEFLKENLPDEYSVILHGDCWIQNIFFKYKENEVVDMKLIDFQMVRVLSPVFDLSTFFYQLASKRSMDDLEIYLKAYHSYLSYYIKLMGSDPNKLYPYTKLKEHWKKYSIYGLTMALFLKVSLCPETDMPDFNSAHGEGFNDLFRFESNIDFEAEWKRRMRDIIIHFYENQII